MSIHILYEMLLKYMIEMVLCIWISFYILPLYEHRIYFLFLKMVFKLNTNIENYIAFVTQTYEVGKKYAKRGRWDTKGKNIFSDDNSFLFKRSLDIVIIYPFNHIFTLIISQATQPIHFYIYLLIHQILIPRYSN